jgi:predicted short-subunit dehydrogenase-like oxidoreductase (DUF2520 family)
MTTPTLNLIGAGRVGQTLAHLWHAKNTFIIQDVLTTSLSSAQQAIRTIGAGTAVNDIQNMRPADVWMIAVPDKNIAIAAIALAQRLHPVTPDNIPIVFHCSGAQNTSVLAPLTEKNLHTASAHCILSFASVQAALEQFAGTACALEGESHACQMLHAAFSAIGAQCFGVQSEHKVLYHAAAVFATNFLPVLQHVAEDAWLSSGVPANLIPQLRAALLRNAVENIIRLGPSDALTGPAARGDTQAIEKQAAVVKAWDCQAGDAYLAMSQLALRMQQTKNSSS